MHRLFFKYFCPFFIIGLALLLRPASSDAAASPLIAIDVGHSKARHGTTSARGKPEFEFNQGMAQVIHETLADHLIGSIMIGADGNMVELTRRTAEAAHAGATFFLSVHHDAAQAQFLQPWMWQGIERRYADEFSGFSLFVSRINVNTEVSLKCARAVGMALKTAGFKPSAHHAEKIPGENRPWADQDAGVYYFDDLVVLKTAASPAILIEAGVIINRAEELNIQTPVTRIAFAQAVAKGLSTCGVTD